MEDRILYNEKPQWFINEMRELRTHIDLKASTETVNHIKETQSSIIKYGIAALMGLISSILGLYVLYYSGLAELKTQVTVMDTKLTGVKEDVTNIKRIISEAEITK